MMTRHEQVPTGAYIRGAAAVVVVGIGAIWLIRSLLLDGLVFLASGLGAITTFLILVYLRRSYSAMRWMAVGIALAALFSVYPILFNVYVGFTNMGGGHLYAKQQAIDRIEAEHYLPEGAPTYDWAGYRDGDDFALLLSGDEGEEVRLVTADGSSEVVEVADPADPPAELDGYRLMAQSEVAPLLSDLASLEFGDPEQPVIIQSLRAAAASTQQYHYDPDADIIVDSSDDTVYRAEEGTFVSDAGEELVPGFISWVGFENFDRFLTNSAIRGPLVQVMVWTFVFAFASVGLSFFIGLGVAVLFDNLPGRRLIRALLIVPYPIPVLVSVLIWRNLLNPDLGTIGKFLGSVFGESPQFLLDSTWTRIALIVVNVWLTYPYFYVVTSGALRAIPEDMLDAAEVDGASGWQRFRFILFPHIFIIVMPLLIASFSFNFNNFNVIYIFNLGNPPMAEAAIPVGTSDILISFIYKLAFASSSAADYGLGAAISVLLFIVVGSVTFLQARASKALDA